MTLRLWVVVLVTAGLMADTCAGPVDASDPASVMEFDIPEQPLTGAIERFSVVTGWQVIYDSSLAAGRRSTRLKGSLSPATALGTLLAGTGLKADHMAADGAVLTAESQPEGRVVETPPAHLRGYYGQVQSRLKRLLCANARMRAGHRIALGLWIGHSGNVLRAEMLGTTELRETDTAFERDIRGLAFDAPPVGFEQPVVVVITPDLVAQCGGASSEGAAR